MTESNNNSSASYNSNNGNQGRGRGRSNYRSGRHGRGGRGSHRNSNNSSYSDRKTASSSTSNFAGECPELKGYIIDINTTGDKFDKTWKKIKEYVGKTYTEGEGSDVV